MKSSLLSSFSSFLCSRFTAVRAARASRADFQLPMSFLGNAPLDVQLVPCWLVCHETLINIFEPCMLLCRKKCVMRKVMIGKLPFIRISVVVWPTLGDRHSRPRTAIIRTAQSVAGGRNEGDAEKSKLRWKSSWDASEMFGPIRNGGRIKWFSLVT
jgi:hypothetical protein